jgi:hypothetical protein
MTDTTLAERLARCVRKSEWTKDARYPETIDAVPAYCIVPDKGTERYRFWMGSNDWSVGFWPTPEAAKAASQADYTARILAALDMDALAQEVEAMVGEEREAIAAWLEAHDYYTAGAERGFSPARFPGMDQHHKAIAAAIRAREGGKP